MADILKSDQDQRELLAQTTQLGIAQYNKNIAEGQASISEFESFKKCESDWLVNHRGMLH